MQLKDLKNKNTNDTIFIVCSGPSLHTIDLDFLQKKHMVMAVNSGILKVPFANFYISDDIDIMSWSYFNIVKKSSCICLFYDSKFKNCIDDSLKERTVFYQHKSWFSPPNIYNLPDGLILTKEGPIIGARTSTASAINISYQLGFNTIILLGNDCQLSQDEYKYRYFWQYWDKKDQPYRIKGGKFTNKTQNIGFNQNSFVEYWNYFAEVNKDNKVKIIDASDSCLECFPKMNLKEILEK